MKRSNCRMVPAGILASAAIIALLLKGSFQEQAAGLLPKLTDGEGLEGMQQRPASGKPSPQPSWRQAMPEVREKELSLPNDSLAILRLGNPPDLPNVERMILAAFEKGMVLERAEEALRLLLAQGLDEMQTNSALILLEAALQVLQSAEYEAMTGREDGADLAMRILYAYADLPEIAKLPIARILAGASFLQAGHVDALERLLSRAPDILGAGELLKAFVRNADWEAGERLALHFLADPRSKALGEAAVDCLLERHGPKVLDFLESSIGGEATSVRAFLALRSAASLTPEVAVPTIRELYRKSLTDPSLEFFHAFSNALQDMNEDQAWRELEVEADGRIRVLMVRSLSAERHSQVLFRLATEGTFSESRPQAILTLSRARKDAEMAELVVALVAESTPDAHWYGLLAAGILAREASRKENVAWISPLRDLLWLLATSRLQPENVRRRALEAVEPLLNGEEKLAFLRGGNPESLKEVLR